jgi:DNA-binding response OmpR family regulator
MLALKIGMTGETRRHRLLIVDDDAAIRLLLQRVALRAGFETETARDGQEAIEKLEYRLYDIVIVDLMMPRVSGFQLIEKISALQPRPTVIVATALTNGDVARIDDSMIRRVIRKPFDLETVATVLIETASEIAERHRITTLPPAVKQIILGDAASHADAAAQHAAVAADHAAAAADHAAAAAEEATKAKGAIDTSGTPLVDEHKKSHL